MTYDEGLEQQAASYADELKKIDIQKGLPAEGLAPWKRMKPIWVKPKDQGENLWYKKLTVDPKPMKSPWTCAEPVYDWLELFVYFI